MKIPHSKQEKHFAFGFIIVIAAIMLFVSFYDKSFHYLDHLNETLVTVDGHDLKLNDLSFYVLYEETLGNSMATTYDSKKPSSFWSKHTNGVFMNGQARRSAIDMMIHDEIFLKMALSANISLTDEDLLIVEERFQDFLNPLTTDQIASVGMTEDDIHEKMKEMALSEKYMIQYADQNGIYFEDFNITGTSYQNLLDQHIVKENKYLINQLNMGKISINHEDY